MPTPTITNKIMTRSETAKLKQLSNVPTPVPAPVPVSAPVVIDNEETESFVEPNYGIIHTMPMGGSVQESAPGRVFYIDHINKTRTWTRPTTAVGVELPTGWGWGVQRQHRLKGELECPTCHYRLKVGVECPTCHYRFPNVIARRTHVDKDLSRKHQFEMNR